jgi:transcriptional regulator with XRE-family HTH domain
MPSVPKPKRARTKHYFAEWREFRGLTQDRAIERLGWSQSKLSRIESGRTPYNEDDLASAALAYDCLPTDIISVNPLKEGELIDITGLLRKAPSTTRAQILAVVSTLLKTAN